MGHETRYTSYDENVNRRAVYAQWTDTLTVETREVL